MDNTLLASIGIGAFSVACSIAVWKYFGYRRRLERERLENRILAQKYR